MDTTDQSSLPLDQAASQLPTPPAPVSGVANGDGLSEGFLHLDPRRIKFEQVLGMIFSAVLFLAAIISFGIWFAISGVNLVFWLSLAASAILLLVLTWFSYFWPAIEFRHVTWRLDETGLEIRRGVIWQHRITVPLARLQHADLSQGPIQRQYGLATLTVHTAGTSNASVELGGLAYETAGWLRDQLIRQRKEIDVV